jgi:pimeloyl-ACP methyl ester carboxylesterase
MGSFATDTGVIAYELLEAQERPAGGTQHPAGSAPTLTLLHNFMSTGEAAWGALLPVLNRTHRILLPDLPGHGRSLGHPPAYHHWAIARQLAALMAHVGAHEGHLAGVSSGGMLAQLLVHHGMVRPRTLTLISTTYSTDPRRNGAGKPLLPENFQAGRRWLEASARMHDVHQGTGYFEQTLLPGFRGLTPATSIDLTLEDLARFRLPVCLIHGEHDEFFPPPVVQAMAAAFPDAELHLIPHQTHALIFRQPARVAGLMEDFLARHEPQQ